MIVYISLLNAYMFKWMKFIVQHPVKKIWVYQQARAENKKAFFSPSNESE